MIPRSELRQRVKDWLKQKRPTGLNEGQIASYVCDLFGKLAGDLLVQKTQIEEERRKDILAFISKESKLLDERDGFKDLAKELLAKLDVDHEYPSMTKHWERNPRCSTCALIEKAKKELLT